MDEDKSKGIIIDKCSTEEDEPEWFHKYINKQKDAEYEGSSAIDEVPSYFNTFE